MTEDRATPAAPPAETDPAAPRVSVRVGISVARMVRFLAAMAAVCAGAAFPASSTFDLRSVDVVGNTAISTDEVLRLAGIGPGVSAFRVNEEAIRHHLREDPRIQDASVAMTFPRRLTLVIREQPPVAALLAGDAYVLIGANGVAIASAPTPGSLPRLVADRLDPADVKVGGAPPSADLRLGARVAGMLPDLLRSQVAAVHVDSNGDATLEMLDGLPVRLGGPWGITDRVGLVPQVLAAIAARGLRVQYVDLRFSGNIIVRPADPANLPAGSPSGHPSAGGRQENPGGRGIQPVMHRPSVP